MSPYLFNVYINDLIEKLSKLRCIKVFAYADDIAITSEGKHNLEKAIDTIDTWCINNKMKLNKNKSQVLYIPWQV